MCQSGRRNMHFRLVALMPRPFWPTNAGRQLVSRLEHHDLYAREGFSSERGQ